MPPKKANVDRDASPFLESVSALFAEQSTMGMTSPEHFKLLREQLITFLEACTRVGITRARAGYSFVFANGSKPDTEVLRPPTWMKFAAGERAVLAKTRKAKSLVKDLKEILKRQGKEQKKALDTRFSDSSPSPEPKKRKRHGAAADDEYAPPQAKKSKLQKPTQGLQHQPPTSRKIKVVRTPDGGSTAGPSRKHHSEKMQTTFSWKVTKNVNNDNDNKHKEVMIKEADNPTNSSSSSEDTQKGIKKEEGPPESNEDSPEDRKPDATHGAPIFQQAPPELDEQSHDSSSKQCPGLTSTPKVAPDLHEQTAETSEENITADQQHPVISLDDTDMDTDAESEGDSQDTVPPCTPAATDSSNSAGFWPSAPKTSISTSTAVLHECALPLRQKEKEVYTPLQRLRASLEIYEAQIAHIPSKTWREYNQKLEKFCRNPNFLDLPFFDRFCGFRRIIYPEEEDAAMCTDDWERLRKAAKLCGFLAEVTAPPGEDARRLVEREVSINIRDINWLEQNLGNKDHLWG